METKDKKKLIEKTHSKLSLKKQCELLSISRSSIYYEPKPQKKDLVLMREIDEQYKEKSEPINPADALENARR